MGVELGHREASAVHRNAVAQADAFQDRLGADFQVESAVFGDTQLLDVAHFFDDPGEEASDWVVRAVPEVGLGSVAGDEEREGGDFRNGIQFEGDFG